MQIANLDLYFVDFDYLKQFDIKMAAGRMFSRSFMTDTTQAMILNEVRCENYLDTDTRRMPLGVTSTSGEEREKSSG